MDVLVCVKRVPDTANAVSLTDDSMSVDARHVGYTVSAHEECAVELAIQTANSTGGTATVLSVGTEDSVQQLRDALAVGCGAAVLVETDPDRLGPADVAGAIADVMKTHESQGRSYGLVLLGNDAQDTGDFQVGIRLAYELGRPVVTGVTTVEVSGDQLTARGEGPGGPEVWEAPVPAVVTIMEGGVDPRYPSIPGRMKAKKVQIETVAPTREPVGNGRVRLTLPPPAPSQVEVLGKGPEAAPVVVDLFQRLGVLR